MDKQTYISTYRYYSDQKIQTLRLWSKTKKPACRKGEKISKAIIKPEHLTDYYIARYPDIGVRCGKTDSGKFLTVIDFDDREIFQQHYLHFTAVEWIHDNSLVVQSGSGRGVHLYFLTDTPIYSSTFNGGEIRGVGNIVVAFNSTHPTGGTYTSNGNQIQAISTEYLEDLQSIYGLKTEKEKPTDTQQDLIQTVENTSESIYNVPPEWILERLPRSLQSHLHAQKGTRSESDMKLLIYLISIGLTLEEVTLFFRIHGTGRYEEGKSIEREYSRAREYYLSHRTKQDELIDTLWYAPLRLNSDRGVLRAILFTMKSTNRKAVTLPLREIVKLTGFTQVTVKKAIDRLIGKGILSRKIQDRKSVYQIHNVQDYTNVFTVGKGNDGIGISLRIMKLIDLYSIGLDTEHRDSMNHSGDSLVQFLNSHIGIELSVKQIAEHLQTDTRTTKNKIKKLSQIVPLKEGRRKNRRGKPSTTYTLTSAITQKDLELIADLSGTTGKQKRKIQEIEQEQAIYQEWQAMRYASTQAMIEEIDTESLPPEEVEFFHNVRYRFRHNIHVTARQYRRLYRLRDYILSTKQLTMEDLLQ